MTGSRAWHESTRGSPVLVPAGILGPKSNTCTCTKPVGNGSRVHSYSFPMGPPTGNSWVFVQIIQVQVHKCINEPNNCGLAGIIIPESIPVPPQNPWEMGHGCTRTRFPRVFPQVNLQVPAGHLYSCHALARSLKKFGTVAHLVYWHMIVY